MAHPHPLGSSEPLIARPVTPAFAVRWFLDVERVVARILPNGDALIVRMRRAS